MPYVTYINLLPTLTDTVKQLHIVYAKYEYCNIVFVQVMFFGYPKLQKSFSRTQQYMCSYFNNPNAQRNLIFSIVDFVVVLVSCALTIIHSTVQV